ncbi:MAG: hypothetical protein M1829_005437 [Trizodia sp. TS-e1964]|nr:MAG: hypothetical protein M1829_005437 [Trizodia sp. TS-e1964]
MPIKIPKAFGRRKSSGNALEDIQSPSAEPSFRVLERPPPGFHQKPAAGSKSFDGGSKLNLLTSIRPKTSENSPDSPKVSSNRDGSKTNSTSTGGTATSKSSIRLSSSTSPSSTDAPSDDLSSYQRAPKEPAVPPTPEPKDRSSSIFNRAGRTFSFGPKAPKLSTPSSKSPERKSPLHNSVEPSSVPPRITRERGMTESSYASTATPPKLESLNDLGASDFGGLGNMFDNFGKRTSTLMPNPSDQILGGQRTESPDNLSHAHPSMPPRSYGSNRANDLTPSPAHIDPLLTKNSPAYSWGSRDSHEGLMSSPTPLPQAQTRTLTPSPFPKATGGGRLQRLAFNAENNSKRSSAYGASRKSVPIEDQDARLVMESVNANRQSYANSGFADKTNRRQEENMFSPSSLDNLPSISNSRSALSNSQPSLPNLSSNAASPYDSKDEKTTYKLASDGTTPKIGLRMVHDKIDIDPSIAASASLAAQFEASLTPSAAEPSQPNRIMTRAQFEKCRLEQDLNRTKSDASKGGDYADDDDAYDDDDEKERTRKLVLQRRKQEAHLAVYRQQMMKVTGEPMSQLPNPNLSSHSTPNLLSGMSTIDLHDASAAKLNSAEDDDEDIPLGILAAHGFPNKNRPPNTLATSQSTSNLRALSSSQFSQSSQRPGSTVGEPAPNRRLPVFAKNLPKDPYYGAGLINQGNRESFHHGNGYSFGNSRNGVPPGGLVGVIAGEERARAMRRGSPNTQPGYGVPIPSSQSMMAQNGGMMPQMQMPMAPGMPAPMNPGEQAQLDMSNQMNQLLQVQMQWMQQMMQMQGLQPSPHPQMGPGNFLSPPGPMQRPYSFGPNSAFNGSEPARSNPRTLSMLDPGPSQWGQFAAPMATQPNTPLGYAASMAPSERSNVGMPSRYRPVSQMPVSKANVRASTFTTNTMQWGGQVANPPETAANVTIRPVATPNASKVAEDDDDEAWESMKNQREQKKSSWKTKRSTSHGFKDFFSGS